MTCEIALIDAQVLRQGAGEDAPGTANTVQSLVWAPEKNGSCISLSIHDISSRHTIVTATISASTMRYLAIMIAPFCLPEGNAAECRNPRGLLRHCIKTDKIVTPTPSYGSVGSFLPQAFYAGAASP